MSITAVANDTNSKGKVRFDQLVRATMSSEQLEILDALADGVAQGNRNAAIRYLIDLHAGRLIEEANARDGEQLGGEVVPFDVGGFKKPKMNREVASYVAGAVAAGLPLEAALDLCGATTQQRRDWWRRGQKDRADGRESVYADYVGAVLQAQALQKKENLDHIRKHRAKTWTSAAWLLERQFPDEFGERKRIDKSVNHSVMPMFDYDKLTLAELRTFLALARKASPESDAPGISRTARPAIELVPQEIIEAVDGDFEELPEALALEAPEPVSESPRD